MPRFHHAAGLMAVLAVGTLCGSPAWAAGDITAGTLVVEHPWSRATPAGAQVGGGYFTVRNTGRMPDRLLGGSFAASSGFELHQMATIGGVMTMRPTGPLDIPAGATLELSPSGKHVMLTGLKRGLTKGETIPGTLVFEHAGTVPVRFAVEAIGAKGPAGAGQTGASMPGMTMN